MAPNSHPTSAQPTGKDLDRCYILKLPAELRLMIFMLTVVRKYPFFWDTKSGDPPLARTCRQMRQETLPIFFKHTHFVLNCADNWKPAIPPRVDEMRLITISSYRLPWGVLLDLTHGLQNWQVSFGRYGSDSIIDESRVDIFKSRVRQAVRRHFEQQTASGFNSWSNSAFQQLLAQLAEVARTQRQVMVDDLVPVSQLF